jgi:hypothetical protein
VDTLLVAAASGLLAMLLGLGAGLVAGRHAERPVAALHVVVAIAVALCAAGYRWYDRPRPLTVARQIWDLRPATITLAALGGTAVLGALVLYDVFGRRVAGALVAHSGAVAWAAGAAVVCLASRVGDGADAPRQRRSARTSDTSGGPSHN